MTKKKCSVHKNMQHNYFIAWPRIMKIDQKDLLFSVTWSKMKRRVTYRDTFNPFPNDKFWTLPN